jgi:hypothetical protein
MFLAISPFAGSLFVVIYTNVTSITIGVYGYNQSYSDVVNWDKTHGFHGNVVKTSDNMTVFRYEGNLYNNQVYLDKQIYIDYDVAGLRTIIIWGQINSTAQNAFDILTQYCIDIAKSVKISPDWVSDGLGRK